MPKEYKSVFEFVEALNNDTTHDFQTILDYEDFQVFKELSTRRYFFIGFDEDNADTFYELKLLARLKYDVVYDLQLSLEEVGSIMGGLFDYDVCGEHIDDEKIEYFWFKRKG